MRNNNHVVTDARFLDGPVRAETYDHKRSTYLILFATPELVHGGGRRRHLIVRVATSVLPKRRCELVANRHEGRHPWRRLCPGLRFPQVSQGHCQKLEGLHTLKIDSNHWSQFTLLGRYRTTLGRRGKLH